MAAGSGSGEAAEAVVTGCSDLSVNDNPASGAGNENSADLKDRTHLPMSNTVKPGHITYDARDPDTKFPPIEQLRPPKGSPNVLIVLIDDATGTEGSRFAASARAKPDPVGGHKPRP